MSTDAAPTHTVTENNNKTTDVEWAYSGKAMRGQNILYSLITLVLLCAAVTVTIKWNRYYAPAWLGFIVLTVVLWAQFCCVYFYRIWTIRYKLTDLRLYCYKGFFTKTQDTMELAFIEDISVTQTLWDRLINGGVGTIKIYSGTDKTNPKPEEGGNSVLCICGVDEPKVLFEEIDNRRSELRRTRSILQATS